MGFVRCHYEGFELCTRSDSFWKLFSVVAFSICDISDGRDMSVVQQCTMVR